MSTTVVVLLIFTVGLAGYNLAAGYKKSFIATSAAGGIAWFGLSLALLELTHPVVEGLAIGLLFFAAGVAPHFRSDPFTPVSKGTGPTPDNVGIVDFSWIAVMGATVGAIVLARGLPPLTERPLEPGLPLETYSLRAENLRFLFGRALTAIVTMGSGLAAAMGILWAGEVWRRKEGTGKDEDQKKEYKATKRKAFKMVVAFFVSVIGVLVGYGWPMYSRLVRLTATMNGGPPS